MLNKLRLKSEFTRNVFTIMSATVLSQLISIFISPILTRIYHPEDYGVLALYGSISAIVAVLATGRYDLAIILPQKDEDAANIGVLSISITLITTIILFLTVFFLNSLITKLLNNMVVSRWLYFIPLTVFLAGIYQAFSCWLNRTKKYKSLALSRILQSITTAGTSLLAGLASLGEMGLIIGGIIGQVIATGTLGWRVWVDDKEKKKIVSFNQVKQQARRYNNFPKYLIVSQLLNTLSSQLPIILLTLLYSSSIVGYFALAQRVISMPMAVVGSAIGEVFRQSASKEFVQKGSCEYIYIRTLKKLIFVSIMPFTILFFLAPQLFNLVFGNRWIEAGNYVQVMIIMFFLQFISSPLSNMYIIAEKQKQDLILQTYIAISNFLALFLGYQLFQEAYYSILLLSLNNTCIYLFNLIITYKYAKGD